MTRSETWRSKASRLLDDYERGVTTERLTQSELAKRAGVSRQTLWRDATLRQRYLRIQEMKASSGGSLVGRATSEMRIRTLQGELARLHRENGLLVQNIIAICRKLREQGLDPRMFVGEAEEDVQQASLRTLHE